MQANHTTRIPFPSAELPLAPFSAQCCCSPLQQYPRPSRSWLLQLSEGPTHPAPLAATQSPNLLRFTDRARSLPCQMAHWLTPAAAGHQG